MTDSQAARAEIEETREALGDTVDALAGKLDVKSRLSTAVDQRKQQVRERIDPAVRRVDESPVPPAAVLVVLAAAITLALLWWRSHHDH